MANTNNIETIDITLRDISISSKSFRVKIFVFEEDFRQILPIVSRKTRNKQLTKIWLDRSLGENEKDATKPLFGLHFPQKINK